MAVNPNQVKTFRAYVSPKSDTQGIELKLAGGGVIQLQPMSVDRFMASLALLAAAEVVFVSNHPKLGFLLSSEPDVSGPN